MKAGKVHKLRLWPSDCDREENGRRIRNRPERCTLYTVHVKDECTARTVALFVCPINWSADWNGEWQVWRCNESKFARYKIMCVCVCVYVNVQAWIRLTWNWAYSIDEPVKRHLSPFYLGEWQPTKGVLGQPKESTSAVSWDEMKWNEIIESDGKLKRKPLKEALSKATENQSATSTV